MGSIYRRGKKLWMAYRGRDGKRRLKATGFLVGQEKEAEAHLKQLEERIRAGVDVMGAENADPSVSQFAKHWHARRKQTIKKADQEESRLRKHVLSAIGEMKLADVRPRHIDDHFHLLRAQSNLAPHSLRNVYALTKALFRDAAIAGLIDSNPCILTSRHLGPDEFKDPIAQANCRYSRHELSTFVYSPTLPPEGRVFCALGGLAGLRLGEIAGLRWGDLDLSAGPLGRMTVARSYDDPTTKTKRVRMVPIHPVLGVILRDWFDAGWRAHVGRSPAPSDLVAPRGTNSLEPGAMLTKKCGEKLMHVMLGRTEFAAPSKITHALRSTFISLALEDGADHYLLEKVTHTTRSGRRAFDVYARPNWDALCREVAKL